MHVPKDRPPKLGQWLLKRFLLEDECHEKLGDFEEGYHIKAIEKGKHKALRWYWLQLIMTIPVFVKNLFYWRFILLRNYFKTALRNMKKHKGYSFINVTGLAVGMACSILILIFIRHELSYDMFHENADDIYRVITKSISNKKLHNSVPGLLGPTLVREFPEVMMSSRLADDDAILKTVKTTEYGARIYSVDPFEYSFLDEKIDNMYKAEKKFGKEFLYFSVIAIFIACLGLIGLASFSAERKTKEVGIRKVLGAPVSSIAVMHSKEFLKWVILANLVACPIAYIIMNKWLQNFAYRIGMSVWLFVFSAFLALIFALLSVSFQTIKAATANPVDSLRYE